MKFLLVFAWCAAQAVVQGASLPEADLYKVPDGLLIGAGISATQAEGAWKDDGKSESTLDRIANFTMLFKEDNHVSADHYHRYAEDIKLAKELGFTSHRFSIAWTRIFPNGDNVPNDKGVQYYHKYIDEVKANGLEPLVTMFHFDHPYSLEESTGGWTNKAMVDKFVEYADFLFKTYGAKVKYWNPINEGNMYCIYVPSMLAAEGRSNYTVNEFYKCLHNTILAHAKTYRLYKQKYYNKEQNGQVGTSVLVWPAQPATDKYEDILAAEQFNIMFNGLPSDPFVHGDYPPIARYLIDKRSREELKLSESRLPEFSAEEKKILIEGGPSTDFIALNVYNGYTVEYNQENQTDEIRTRVILEPIRSDMENIRVLNGGGFELTDENLMKHALLWIYGRYHLPIVITENGYGDGRGDGIHDYSSRGHFFSVHLRSLVRTMNEFHVPVISFHAWSLMDSFEFTAGYTERPFGLIYVNYTGTGLERKLKDSSRFFQELAREHRVPLVSSSSSSSPALILLVLTLAGKALISIVS